MPSVLGHFGPHFGIKSAICANMSPSTKEDSGKKNVVVIGAGAAGMACAWSLAKSGKFNVTVLESASHPGGVATTTTVKNGARINGGVQGGALSYCNMLTIIKMLGFQEHLVDIKVSFGTGERQWSNHILTDKIKKHAAEWIKANQSTFDSWIK